MPRVGVEEEFLIVDCVDGHAVPLGGLLERLNDDDGLSSEMKQEQIETCTLPRITLDELAQDITARRASADSTARTVGARSVALAKSPLPVHSTATPGLRYQRMIQRFGLTAVEQLTCGSHVHVEVESDEEAFAKAGSFCDVIADAVEVSSLPAAALGKPADSPLLASDQSL